MNHTRKPCIYLDVRGACNFLGSVSPQQRFEMVDRCYSSVTAQFYLANKNSIPSRHKGGLTPKERPQSILASSFYMFVSSPASSLPCTNWASKKGVCFFHLKFSLQSMDLLLLHFCRLFSFFVLQPPPFWTPFSYSNYLTVIIRKI